VIHDFQNDLFPAYSTVMNLKAVNSSGGRWVFLLNDTNLATLNETRMPTLYISVQGQAAATPTRSRSPSRRSRSTAP
jgi:hypothetical protein